jgi:hypothetical protein
MSNNIVFIGVQLPDELGEYVSIKSKASLLDYDIAIIDPDIDSIYSGFNDDYCGKPCLSDSKSFALNEQLEHWKREIRDAVEAGKTVFILANRLEEVYVATGAKEYSGTGRSQKTKRIVALTDNYKIIPDSLNVTNTEGCKIILDPKALAFSDYWSNYGKDSSYLVIIKSNIITKALVTKHGDKIVGGYYKTKNNGALVILPYIDFENEKFTETKKDGTYWSKKGLSYTKGFISNIVKLSDSLKSENTYTPAPDWVDAAEYVLKEEEKVKQNLLNIESKIEKLQEQREEEHKTLSKVTEVKALLYEKGKPLENAIINGLKLLGFEAENFKESDSEFDVVFTSPEGRLIGEAEGKDNKAINVDKLRQLEMNINEDFEREEVKEMAKAVLIGNAFRLINPLERDCFFTEKCQTAANRSNTALLSTAELYKAVQYLSDNKIESYAKKCRKSIIETVGIVSMPEPPRTKKITSEINSEKDA